MNVQVTSADGGTAVVAFRRQSPAKIETAVRAWALLHQREVRSWERTSLPAEFWYDGRKRHMCRYGDSVCRDLLEMLIPPAVAFEQRQREVLALRGRGIQPEEIARQLRIPLPTVDRMIQESAATAPFTDETRLDRTCS